MALTREQRKRIEQEEQLKMEEESYRAEVRKKARTEPEESGGGFSPLTKLTIVLVLFGFAYVYLSALSG